MKHYSYITQGTCSRQIDIDVDDNGCVQNVSFVGGCHGNLQGICALIRGMKAEDVKARLQGIPAAPSPPVVLTSWLRLWKRWDSDAETLIMETEKANADD